MDAEVQPLVEAIKKNELLSPDNASKSNIKKDKSPSPSPSEYISNDENKQLLEEAIKESENLVSDDNSDNTSYNDDNEQPEYSLSSPTTKTKENLHNDNDDDDDVDDEASDDNKQQQSDADDEAIIVKYDENKKDEKAVSSAAVNVQTVDEEEQTNSPQTNATNQREKGSSLKSQNINKNESESKNESEIANENENENDEKMYDSKYALPTKLGGVPIESTVKLDQTDMEFYKKIQQKYGSQIASRKLESNFIHRYVVGYKHIKKKKRMQAIEKEIEFHFEHHDQYKIDSITKTKSSAQELDAWKQFIYGEDKYGHPIIYDLIGSSDCKKMQKVFLDKNEPFGERAYFHVFRFMRKVENYKASNSQKYGTMIHKHIQIMDMKGFVSDHLKGKNRKMTKLMIGTLTNMYPETTYKMYIINAPWPFRALWSVVKAFMDPITVDKTKVLGEDYLKTMLKDIPINMIPKEYGGKGPWEIQYGGAPKHYPVDVHHGVDD